MRRILAVLAAVAITAAGLVQATPAQAATPPLKFGRFVADQAGTDLPVSRTKLNAEYIRFSNTTKKSINLTGYTVKDAGSKHTFKFPKNYVIKPGKTVTLHTGTGKNTSTDLYWGMTKQYVWNNTGDTARLINSKGKVVHSCTYKKVKSGVKNC